MSNISKIVATPYAGIAISAVYGMSSNSEVALAESSAMSMSSSSSSYVVMETHPEELNDTKKIISIPSSEPTTSDALVKLEETNLDEAALSKPNIPHQKSLTEVCSTFSHEDIENTTRRMIALSPHSPPNNDLFDTFALLGAELAKDSCVQEKYNQIVGQLCIEDTTSKEVDEKNLVEELQRQMESITAENVMLRKHNDAKDASIREMRAQLEKTRVQETRVEDDQIQTTKELPMKKLSISSRGPQPTVPAATPSGPYSDTARDESSGSSIGTISIGMKSAPTKGIAVAVTVAVAILFLARCDQYKKMSSSRAARNKIDGIASACTCFIHRYILKAMGN